MTQPRVFSANGVRRTRSETVHRSDAANWRSGATAAKGGGYQSGHVSSNSSSPPSGPRNPSEDDELIVAGGNRGGAHDNPVHGRLLFLTMCLVGQLVEVQLKDGSVYSGIFHTANVDKDFGVVLKMARLTKEATGKAGKTEAVKQAARRPPMKLLIVYAKDLVQIVAKEVLLTGEAFPNGRSRENKNELLTDSFISRSRRDTERELKPWKPDSEAPRNLGLESTFHNPWNRNWDQFQTNKDLFGVETTFDEELYTTKLERGPQTREREREASRLAREIEVESTRNISIEDRVGSDTEFDTLDEESRHSSVLRPRNGDDGGDDGHNKNDDFNEETFGSAAVTSETVPGSPRSSASAGDTGLPSSNVNPTSGPASDEVPRESKILENVKKGKKDQVNDLKHFAERTVKNFDTRLAKSSSAAAKLADDMKDGTSKHAQASISPPPASALPIPVVLNATLSVARSPNKVPAPSPPEVPRATSLDASREDAEPVPSAAAAGTSFGGTGVKKSSLNPNAKEFKLNPNAKVFTPSFSSTRPASPVNQQTAIYVPAAVPISPMPGMPVGMGYMQQPGQPAQFAQYNTMAATGVTAAPYIQPSAPFVPGAAVPPVKVPAQTQPQVTATPYGQQAMRFMPPPTPAYPHPSYPQQVIYGHQQLVYFPQFHQGMIQGQPVPMLPPQPSAQLSQPQKHPGSGESSSHHNSPNVVVGQSPVQSPLPSPVPRSQQSAAAPAPSAGGTKAATNGASRGGNKN